jgi:hypothetical protein
VSIVPIVEGQAEVESVPVLLRRLRDRCGRYDVQVARPFRVKRSRVGQTEKGELERAIKLATADRPDPGAVLVVLDADDDCPRTMAPPLLERCRQATSLPVGVVLANREFEAWFLGAKQSLKGVRGIRPDAQAPANPEEVRNAKGRLTQNMQGGRTYNSVDDQPALAEKMDLDLARRRCPSFDKFVREVTRLLSEIPQTPPNA